MQPDMQTPNRVLDGVGYRVEHRAALDAWRLRRPSRGIPFPDLARTRARLAETVSPAPGRTLQHDPLQQRTLPFAWPVDVRRTTPWYAL